MLGEQLSNAIELHHNEDSQWLSRAPVCQRTVLGLGLGLRVRVEARIGVGNQCCVYESGTGMAFEFVRSSSVVPVPSQVGGGQQGWGQG